jgi:hypothetical protein
METSSRLAVAMSLDDGSRAFRLRADRLQSLRSRRLDVAVPADVAETGCLSGCPASGGWRPRGAGTT